MTLYPLLFCSFNGVNECYKIILGVQFNIPFNPPVLVCVCYKNGSQTILCVCKHAPRIGIGLFRFTG